MERFENFNLTRDELDNIRKDPKLVKIGMGGTYGIGSDDYPFEVISILDDRHLMCRRLESKQVGDYFGDQKWELYHDEKGEQFKLFFKDGCWRRQDGRTLNRSGYYSVGYAVKYEDPSF